MDTGQQLRNSWLVLVGGLLSYLLIVQDHNMRNIESNCRRQKNWRRKRAERPGLSLQGMGI